jgi:hypothetical protein
MGCRVALDKNRASVLKLRAAGAESFAEWFVDKIRAIELQLLGDCRNRANN